MKHKVSRLIYVGSVHAISEGEPFSVIKEVEAFSPEQVVGDYAKSKAIAAQCVLNAVKEGLNAVSVFPSGILGPFDTMGNHLVQLVDDYRRGKVPAGVRGGYDFVDVRDVALGCLAAVKYGKNGEGYILSNRHYDIKDLFSMIRAQRGGRKVPMLPLWVARASVSTAKFYAKMKNQRPLFTKYSLYTLRSNDRFSHDKATAELHYYPRDLRYTIRDTIRWLEKRRSSTG